MSDDAPALRAERTDGGLLLREQGNGDAWIKADATIDAEP